MENDVNSRDSRQQSYYADNKGYALSGRIMLSTIVVMFFVIIFMFFLHLYARWYFTRAPHRQSRGRRQRRTRFVFYVEPTNPSNSAPSRGLDAYVLKSLPVFVYSSKTHADSKDCAVCLCEFEENESGRVLPRCNHSFHIDCINMWFQSHSNCPVCRSPVQLETGKSQNPTRDVSTQPGNPVEVSVQEPGSSSVAEPTVCDSSASQGSSFVSSFKRMLSRDQKGNSTASGNDMDIERGGEETQR